jgi:hypothetical protein
MQLIRIFPKEELFVRKNSRKSKKIPELEKKRRKIRKYACHSRCPESRHLTWSFTIG